MGYDSPVTASGARADDFPMLNVKVDFNAVGDGIRDDTAEIQAAEDAASAAKGIVLFPPGDYFISTLLTKKRNSHWLGSGQGATYMTASDSNSSVVVATTGYTTANATSLSVDVAANDRDVTLTSVTGYVVGDYIELRNSGSSRYFQTKVIAISGSVVTLEERCPIPIPAASSTVNRVTAYCDNWSIRGITFRSSTQEPTTQTTRKSGCIQMNGSRDAWIEACDFIGFASDTGGRVVGCDTGLNLRLQGLRFYNCADSDPTPSQNSKMTYFLRVVGLVETGNIFRRCGGSKTCGHAQSIDVIFNDNKIGGHGDWGGYAETTTTGSQTLPVTPLNVTDTTNFLGAGTNIAWVASGSPAYTTNPQKITYTGKTATTLTGVSGGSGVVAAGTVVSGPQTTATAGQVPGLPADSGGRGVSWEDWCCNWTCSNNIFHDTGFDGIRADGGINGQIIGNALFNCRDVPIFCTSGNGSSVSSDIIIANNRVYFSTVNSNFHGIAAAGGASRLMIMGNIVSNSQNVGIYLTSNNTDCVISGNIVSTTGGRGIRLDAGCTRCSIHGNIVRGSTGAAIRTTDTSGGNHVYGNIGNGAFEIHASDKQTLDTAANSNWVQ